MNNKKRILIVEDEVALLYALQSQLSLEGFEVEAVSTGKAALKALSEKKIDLLVLDIILPDIDGFEILKRIKEVPKTKNIPTVIISNIGDKEHIKRGISLGVKDYIPKSEYNLKDIIEKIKTLSKH